jgi:hypothetical protein
MAKQHKRLIVAVAVGIIVSAMAIGGSAYITRTAGTHAEATDNVRVVDDRKPPEQWAINAAYGRGALSNLQAALTEIANDNAEEARKGVAVAQSLLAKIKPESAQATVDASGVPVTPIPDGDPNVQAALILVHSEVSVLGDARPGNSMQAKLDSIRHEFSMTDHESIITSLDSLNIPLTYTRVDLPLTETIILVNEVLQALDSRDAGRARSKLMEIGSRLRIETLQVGTEAVPVDSEVEDNTG